MSSDLDRSTAPSIASDGDTDARSELTRIARSAAAASDAELSQLAAMLADLLGAADLLHEDADAAARAEEIVSFCQSAMTEVQAAMAGEDAAVQRLQEIQHSAHDRWGDYPELLPEHERCRPLADDAWGGSLADAWPDSAPDSPAEQDAAEPGGSLHDGSATELDLQRIVASLDLLTGPVSSQPVAPPRAVLPASLTTGSSHSSSRAPLAPPPLVQQLDDPDLLASYIDDAHHCLAGMESALMAIDAGTPHREPLLQFCRELHTLKGASGTVGLDALAAYLHELETRTAVMSVGAGAVDTDMLLGCVDAVRAQLNALQPDADFAPAAAAFTPTAAPAASNTDEPSERQPQATPSEAMIRLEASRLDRLMDLLAELVQLRNRRDSYAAGLRRLHSELAGCANRVRAVDAVMPFSSTTLPVESSDEPTAAELAQGEGASGSRQLSRTLLEIAGDLSEVGRTLQNIVDPFSADNLAVSDLIGEFRRELMELRRQPVGGLFQRLCRSARDAARAEGKQVEFELIGQGARAERSLQERLFEPLMHLVRNAVSHGVETPQQRAAAGKSPAGKITLSAGSDASTLTIEIRDDGAGINNDAIERRGRELGLLPVGQPVDQQRLWKLIFHPGFSTRSEVSAVAGRGVGMDVVASWIRQLRGRIDIDSAPGEGTTFRLQIPLRSAIEHALIVRVGSQLFALPLRGVDVSRTAADDSGHHTDHSGEPVHLRSLLGMEQPVHSESRLLYLRPQRMAEAADRSHAAADVRLLPIAVDAVLGVEEVVVRSLPPLLQGHELFSGVTLSGQSETVLLFDAARLCELAQSSVQGSAPAIGSESTAAGGSLARDRVLVVDDSLSVRRSIVRRLNARGFRTVEAADGLQALDMLRQEGVMAVVSDLDMPRMGGLELLVEMRHGKRYRDIPVTIVSSRDDEPTLTRLTEMKADCILKKPVTDDTVTRIVEVIRTKGSGVAD